MPSTSRPSGQRRRPGRTDRTFLLLASDPNYGGVAVLTVFEASTETDQFIGTMNRIGGFGAVLPMATKPGTIRVVSSITGASATATVQ